MSEATALEATQRETVKSAVLTAAETPQKLSALKKAAKNAVTEAKEKKLAEAVVDEMVTAGELHTYGSGEKTLYGKDEPNDKVQAALLTAAATPQTKEKLVKAIVKTTKADESFVGSQVEKLIEDQRLHNHGTSEKALYGKDKPLDPNDPEKVNAALLDAAVTPQTLAKLVKTATKATKAGESFVTDQANKLIANQQLHQHGSDKKATFGKDKPVDPNDPEKVNAALLEAATTLQTESGLVAAAAKATKATKDFVTAQAKSLIADQKLHKHRPTSGNKPHYGKEPPPTQNVKEPVIAALLAAAESPQTFGQLVKATTKATGADEEYTESLLKELIASGKLFQWDAGKKPTYGREKPDPLSADPGKKAFTALVKAAEKVREVAPTVALDEVLKRLREALSEETKKPEVVSPHDSSKDTSQVDEPKPEPPAPPTPELRAVLKAAYDELCLDVEFQHKTVELRRLYHEARRRRPSLTVEQFHHELETLQKHHAVELHALNEVQHAKEQELAIRHGDRLLYYVIWR